MSRGLQVLRILGRGPQTIKGLELLDWTLESNIVDSLFCATLTGRRRGHTSFVKAGETSDTGTERKRPTPVRRRLSRTHAVLGKAISGWWTVIALW